MPIDHFPVVLFKHPPYELLILYVIEHNDLRFAENYVVSTSYLARSRWIWLQRAQ